MKMPDLFDNTNEMYIPEDLYESVKADYINEEFIIPPDPVKRLNIGQDRYYVTEVDGKRIMSPSVTTILKEVPQSFNLIQWQVNQGAEKSAWTLKYSAMYGTFLHIAYKDLALGMPVNSNSFHSRLFNFCEEEAKRGLRDSDFGTNEHELTGTLLGVASEAAIYYHNILKFMKENNRDFYKDVISFIMFVQQYKVQFIAIEYPFVLPDYSGTIDFIVKMSYPVKGFYGEAYKTGSKKGQPKETIQEVDIIAAVDVKSGQSGFFPTHEMQLEAYKDAWERIYPKIKIDRTFNFAPANFRLPVSDNTTFFKLKDQTDSVNGKKYKHYLAGHNMNNPQKSSIHYFDHNFDFHIETNPIESIKGFDFEGDK
jgi:hypothetical protein